MAQVNLRRVRKAVAQEARRQDRAGRVDGAMEVLEALVPQLGELSLSRQMLGRIGRAILREPTEVVVPLCPDYGHKEGRYTFSGMGGGVSLMLHKYLPLLQYLAGATQVRVTLLYADVEIDDVELLASVGVDRDVFCAKLQASVEATRAFMRECGWSVHLMSEHIDDIQVRTDAGVARIESELRARMTSELLSNQAMCLRIDPRMSLARMRARLTRTAAQYMALGQWAHEHGALVVDGTSMVSWYRQTPAALVHANVTY